MQSFIGVVVVILGLITVWCGVSLINTPRIITEYSNGDGFAVIARYTDYESKFIAIHDVFLTRAEAEKDAEKRNLANEYNYSIPKAMKFEAIPLMQAIKERRDR